MDTPNWDKYKNLIIVLSIVIIVVLLIVALNTGKPNDVSDQHYKYALQAIEIADRYLDYEITALEADIQLDALKAREGELPDTPVSEASFSNDHSIVRKVSSLSYSLSSAKYLATSEKYNDVLEKRNELAEIIDEKKR